jgi:uncharacterized membrane protein YjfL (UPF0719 family)
MRRRALRAIKQWLGLAFFALVFSLVFGRFRTLPWWLAWSAVGTVIGMLGYETTRLLLRRIRARRRAPLR